MIKFKGARLEGNNIVLTTPVSQEEFSKFCKDLYGGRIPIYKPVGMFLKHSGNPGEVRCEKDYVDIKSYDFIKNLSDYIPVETKQLPGAYTSQGTPIEFDTSLEKQAKFKKAAEVKGRRSIEMAVMSPFATNLNMDDVVQVFAAVPREEYATDLDEYKKEYASLGVPADQLQVVTTNITERYGSTRFGCIMAPKRVKINYKDFNYYGFDTIENGVVDNPPVLYEDAKELLYVCAGHNRLRTPIIVCYRGTGEMTAGKIVNTLFDEPIKDFVPFEHVRFNISNFVGVNMAAFKPDTNIIPLTFFKEINRDSLQKIIDYYGEVD